MPSQQQSFAQATLLGQVAQPKGAILLIRDQELPLNPSAPAHAPSHPEIHVDHLSGFSRTLPETSQEPTIGFHLNFLGALQSGLDLLLPPALAASHQGHKLSHREAFQGLLLRVLDLPVDPCVKGRCRLLPPALFHPSGHLFLQVEVGRRTVRLLRIIHLLQTNHLPPAGLVGQVGKHLNRDAAS